MNQPICISRNLSGVKFMWLGTKYVRGFNETKHCTNSLGGRYSKKLWKNNTTLKQRGEEVLDEQPDGWSVIYICGVAKAGYSSKKSYPHNLHAAIIPMPGKNDEHSIATLFFNPSLTNEAYMLFTFTKLHKHQT